MTEKKSSWGWGVAALYGGFVLFLLILVVYISFQRFEMVEGDYYNEGLKYQQHIDKVNRTMALDSSVVIRYSTSDRALDILFPSTFLPDSIRGTIQLYRPSNSLLDRSYPIDVSGDFRQIVDVDDLVPGLWKVKINWHYGADDYYSEKKIFVPK